MTIIECVNEKTALNLNPFQVFVFLNEKTKKYENRLRLLADRQQLFHYVFIDDDPRSHIQAHLPETMDFQLYMLAMNSDIVARVMPKWAGDYRYLTEILPAGDDWPTAEKMVMIVTSKLRNEQYHSKTNTLRRYFQYGNTAFVDFLNDVYQGDLQRVVDMSSYYTRINMSNDFRRAEQFAYRFFQKLNEEQLYTINQMMKETLDYTSEEDSLLILDNFIHYQSEEEADDDHHIAKPRFKIVISPQDRKPSEAEGRYAITIVTDKGEQHNLTFPHKGAKIIYLLTLLCQTKIGGLPTNYFKTDESLQIIGKIYDKLYSVGGMEWAKKLGEKIHNITMYRTHASESIKKDVWMEKNIAYWIDFENIKVMVRNRKVALRSIRLPKENIVIQDHPDDQEPLSMIVKMMPPLDTLFGVRNRKAISFLEEINKNLVLATKDPVMDYDELNISGYRRPDYLE